MITEGSPKRSARNPFAVFVVTVALVGLGAWFAFIYFFNQDVRPLGTNFFRWVYEGGLNNPDAVDGRLVWEAVRADWKVWASMCTTIGAIVTLGIGTRGR